MTDANAPRVWIGCLECGNAGSLVGDWYDATEAGDITIRITSTAQTTTVAVENTGTDIDAKILPRLFDRFYRADASRAHPGSDGSGLGLAITRAIAEAHGGSVSVSNGAGASFTIRLPLSRAAVPAVSVH